MDWSDYDAALFDLDGVITPTADVHMHAWAEMFGAFLDEQGIDEPYTDAGDEVAVVQQPALLPPAGEQPFQ